MDKHVYPAYKVACSAKDLLLIVKNARKRNIILMVQHANQNVILDVLYVTRVQALNAPHVLLIITYSGQHVIHNVLVVSGEIQQPLDAHYVHLNAHNVLIQPQLVLNVKKTIICISKIVLLNVQRVTGRMW